MRSYTSTSSTTLSRPFDLLAQVTASLVAGVVIFLVLLFSLALGYSAYHAGQIYPGVSVAGVDLSAMEPDQAAALLAERFEYPAQGRILLADGDKIWLASPSDLGFYLDPQATAMRAYRFGRHGSPVARLASQFKAWYYGASLPAQFVFDEPRAYQYLQGVAGQTDRPTIDASLSVDGVDVVVRPGQVGRSVDIPATIDLLRGQLQTLRDGEISLVISESPPAILDVSEQADLARQILSAPLTLAVPDAGEDDPGPWSFKPDMLADMLTIERVPAPQGDVYQVGLQADLLRSFLEGIAPQLVRQRQNARFIFNDETRQLEVIQPAVTGRELDVDATIQSINDKLLAGDHHISLDLEYSQPEIGDDATAEQLGITELVSSQTSYFYGSSGERIHNIQTAAARFHGLLVPPGSTFSMADALGDVSLDTGYAEALIIFGNRTIEGVGGGVCQVSTTLFRTVFFGGYPVVERYPHAYRVYYYELRADGSVNTELAGLDATVYVPLVDFKFTNDTPDWLLMETYVSPEARTLTWKFYSTSDGRQVEWDTSGLKNKEEPPKPSYEENPDLEKGEIKQVDWEVEGADVTVTRTVTRDGQVLDDDTFTTHYMPWRAVYEYGPGTKGMPPDEDKPKKKDKDN
jgi:vancomycin resistance protein YoaR